MSKFIVNGVSLLHMLMIVWSFHIFKKLLFCGLKKSFFGCRYCVTMSQPDTSTFKRSIASSVHPTGLSHIFG